MAKNKKEGERIYSKNKEGQPSNFEKLNPHTPPNCATVDQKTTKKPNSKRHTKNSILENGGGKDLHLDSSSCNSNKKSNQSKTKFNKTSTEKEGLIEDFDKIKKKAMASDGEKIQKTLEKIKKRKSSSPIIFFGDHCCLDATKYATLIGKAYLNKFKKEDKISQDILLELNSYPEGINKTDLSKKLGVNKSTITRKLAIRPLNSLVEVKKSGIIHTCKLSMKGKLMMKQVLQLFNGYETDDKSRTPPTILLRYHKLYYKVEVYRLPKELNPEFRIKKHTIRNGKSVEGEYVGDWHIWEVKNNVRFHRIIPLRIQIDDFEYTEEIGINFNFDASGDRFIYIHLPEIPTETFSDAKRKVNDLLLEILKVLREQGFRFKGGDYFNAEAVPVDGEYAIVGHPFARLCKAMDVSYMESENWKMDSSDAPELEAYGPKGEEIGEREFERLNLQATYVLDKNGKKVQLLDTVRTQVMAYENKRTIYELEQELSRLIKVIRDSVKDISDSTANGFKEVSNKMDFHMGGLPLNTQADLIRKAIELEQQNRGLKELIENYEKLVKEMKK